MAQLYRTQTLELYRLLLRSASLHMPTKTAREFMVERVRTEFRKNAKETDLARIQNHLDRAYAVLIASTREADRKALGVTFG